jgi:hypothetical protein
LFFKFSSNLQSGLPMILSGRLWQNCTFEGWNLGMATARLSVFSAPLLFQTVFQAFRELDISITEEPDPKMVLIWDDSLHLFRDAPREYHYFRKLSSWQVINRIPRMNIICRKVPLVQTLRTFGERFPGKLDFLPRSYILTDACDRRAFLRAVTREKHIIKPTDGSLGKGIRIVEAGEQYVDERNEAVGQQYIESAQLNDRKFDLRVYALVISTKPLSVYVYRDGVARVCSDPVSANTIFSQITNTAVNIGNATASAITFMIAGVFRDLSRHYGISSDALWGAIDRVIAKTVVAANEAICDGIRELEGVRGVMTYPRYFQLIGFDILLDRNLKPWILEVNYRPSLEFGTSDEKQLKVRMLTEVIQIAAPLEPVEAYLHHKRTTVSGASLKDWLDKKKRHKSVLDEIKEKQRLAVVNSQFVKVLGPENWREFLDQLQSPKNGQTHIKPVIVVPKFKKGGRAKHHRAREKESSHRSRRDRSPQACPSNEEQCGTEAEATNADE